MIAALARHLLALLPAIPYALALLGTGAASWRWCAGPGRDEFIFRLAAGLAVVATLVFGLALTRLWFPPVLWAVILGAAAAGSTPAARLARAGLPRLHAAAAVIAWLMAGWALIFALVPVTNVDALNYHLAAPQQYLLAHGWYVDRASQPFRLPLLGEMLYAWPVSFRNEAIPGCLVLLGTLLAALSVVRLSRLPLNAGGAWMVGWLFVTNAQILILLAGPKIDLLALGFGAAAILAVERGRFTAAWLLAGCALATKLTMALAIPVLAAWPWMSGHTGGRRRRALLRRSWLMIVPLIPWLAKNALAYGNPLPMFGSGFIPTLDWSPASLTAVRSLLEAFAPPGTARPDGALWHVVIRMFRSSPGLLLAAIVLWPAAGHAARRLALTSALLSWAYIWLTRSDRYGLSADLFLAVAIGWMLRDAGVTRRTRRRVAWLRVGLVAAGIVPAAAQAPLLTAAAPWQCLIGRETPDAYLARNLGPLHEVLVRVNRDEHPAALLLSGECRIYRFESRVAATLSFGLPPVPWTLARASRTPEEYRKGLRQLGLTHVLHNYVTAMYQMAAMTPFPWNDRMLTLYRDVVRRYFRPIGGSSIAEYANGGFALSRIAAERDAPLPPRPLLDYLPGAEGIFLDKVAAERLKDPAGVRRAMQRLLLVAPDVVELHDEMANLHYALGEWELARREYLPGIRAGVVDDGNWYGFATASMKTGHLTDARSAFVRAEALYPMRRAFILTNLATLEFDDAQAAERAGRLAEAEAGYGRADARLNDLPPSAARTEAAALVWARLARVRLDRGDAAGAAAAAARARQILPAAARSEVILTVLKRLRERPTR